MANSHTTPERWKAVPGFETLFQVSDQGRVRSIPDEVLRPLYSSPKGYLSYTFHGPNGAKTYRINRLVLIAFDREPLPGEQSDHINFDVRDNRLENLRWVSDTANREHSNRAGRRPKGEGHYKAKLNAGIVMEIRRRYDSRERIGDIARSLGLSDDHVAHVAKRRSWKSVA